MPPRTRRCRRNNTKRTILGAVSENGRSSEENCAEATKTRIPSNTELHTIPDDNESGNHSKFQLILMELVKNQ